MIAICLANIDELGGHGSVCTHRRAQLWDRVVLRKELVRSSEDKDGITMTFHEMVPNVLQSIVYEAMIEPVL